MLRSPRCRFRSSTGSRARRQAFSINAAAGIVVLLVTMLVLNGVAIYLRNRLQKKEPEP